MKRRLAVLASAILTIVATVAAPVGAAEMYLSKTSGNNATASWAQYDGMTVGSAFGNVHIGWLEAYSTSKGVGDVFMYIDDFDCEPGQTPYGGHGDTEDGACLYVGTRWGSGYGLTFTIDKKFNSAHVTGSIELYGGGHGSEGVVGTPQLNVIWTGYGSTASNTYSYRWVQDGTTYTQRYRGTSRSASVDGTIGPMGFAPDTYGALSSYKSHSAQRSK